MVAILRTVIVTSKTWDEYIYRSRFWRRKPKPQLSNLLGWAKAYPFRIFSHGPIDGWWLSCLRLWWLQIEHQITTHKITSYETTYLVACYCWCYGWCWIWCGLWWMWVWCFFLSYISGSCQCVFAEPGINHLMKKNLTFWRSLSLMWHEDRGRSEWHFSHFGPKTIGNEHFWVELWYFVVSCYRLCYLI